MFLNSLPIAPALIAGVIVIVVDWKNSASAASAKSSKLQRPKICVVGCDVLQGVGN